MTINDIIEEGRSIPVTFHFIEYFDEVDRTDNTVKFRLYIDEGFYIQVYANSIKEKLSFALIYHNRKIFGRDFEGKRWHWHPYQNPTSHEFNGEGGRKVSLKEFVCEVQKILIEEELI